MQPPRRSRSADAGMAGVSTRAHTAPKFYLNGFLAPGTHERNPFVWLGSLTTGEIVKRSPKNISISRGLYDGRGGFEEADATIEAHLSKIESAASYVNLPPRRSEEVIQFRRR